MTSHEEMLERMNRANPLPDVDMITDGQLAEMTLQVEEARRTGQLQGQTQELTPVKQRGWWLRPAVAFAAALLVAFAVIGAVSLTTGGESEVADEPSSTTTPSTTVNPPPEGWNPMLATTFAGPIPEPAVCPAGTDPSSPGPADQERPGLGGSGLLSAAFDHRTGQVIYVDEERSTWAFDVCTNTWTDLRPTGVPTGNLSDGLVYDIDSDVTVSIEPDEIFVYDASSNEWENRVNTSDFRHEPVAAVYDPVSGLIVTSNPYSEAAGSDDWFVKAYDVDTDTWHNLGAVPPGIDLLGYSAELDRMVLTTYVDDQEATLLLDPRTGELSTHIIPTPVVNLGWPSRSYGQAETVYVQTEGRVEYGRWNDVLCGFDPNEIAWTKCHSAPQEFPTLKYDSFNAIVGDPINDRLLLLGGMFNTFSNSPGGVNDVWAIDLESGEWTQVVAPTDVTAADSPATIDAGASGEWNLVLATTLAGTPPAPATCPGGTDPSTPGPIDQERPTTVDDDHDGTFDRRTGRVMYVDMTQHTWAFDVCTNTWNDLEPDGIPHDESLVYDVDSDVTLTIAGGFFDVYDSDQNTWTSPPVEVVGGAAPDGFYGVAYDPISGLVVTAADGQVWAYDVATGTLTLLGPAPFASQLAGYVASLDRLLFVADFQTVLVDPRTGEVEVPTTGAVPFAGWGWYDFFDAAGTVFIGATVEGSFEGCGFNPTTLAWDLCLEQVSPRIETFASRVEDSINGRVVLIHHSQIQDEIINDVWALDLATGEMTELLAPSE